MIIPLTQISADTLDAIIEDFVLREGTDYGNDDISNREKVAQVKQQLHSGIAVLVYSELHESVNILPAEQFHNSSEEL